MQAIEKSTPQGGVRLGSIGVVFFIRIPPYDITSKLNCAHVDAPLAITLIDRHKDRCLMGEIGNDCANPSPC